MFKSSSDKPSDDVPSARIPERISGTVPPEDARDQTVVITPDMLVQLPEGAAPTNEAPLALFGRYQARSVLGSGGYGTVYLGYDPQLARSVAIKVLRRGGQASQSMIDEFLEEARRLAQLHHPGIVAVHDVGVQGGEVYIVSEFLSGSNLGEWLGSNQLSWLEAARIAAGVADALAHAHSRLIVHRDIKPANIIITTDRTPVLVDFGIGLDETKTDGSERGVVKGTPVYMSPEQIAGEGHRIDGRTDIYSLGVVLYAMLCGRVPFRSRDSAELLRQVLRDEPQPPRQLSNIPPELERICLKALEKRMQDRYTTAADFANDLRCLCDSLSPSQDLSVLPARSKTTSGSRPSDTPSAERRAREAERRQLSVLVCGCDVFESEDYLERTEAEDQAAVLKAFQHICETVVRRFEGNVVQCNEQGLLACFGYPVAFEDAAHRAALAGLGILDEIKNTTLPLCDGKELEVKPWVGIHTGTAVAEMGEGTLSLVGDARNTAVRLEGVAIAGKVVCSGATHRLIRDHFTCASLGQTRIKGMSKPLDIFEVREVVDDRRRLEAAAEVGFTPLIGRDNEVSLLKDRWEQALEGMGQVVLIAGEAGLGKSRLIYTLKRYVEDEAGVGAKSLPVSAGGSPFTRATSDRPVIEWRCSPHYRNTSLYPVIDFFEQFLGFSRDIEPAARFDRLIRHLQYLGLARPELVPLFASLMSLPLDDRFSASSLSAIREREELFLALQEWLRAYSTKQPVLFVIEDLHWADASTLEFLGQFISGGLRDRVLTLATFRPEFKSPWPAVSHQTSLGLNRLTRRQVDDMVRKKTENLSLADAVIDQVYERAGGVPLFVEEFTKMIQESGVLDRGTENAADIKERISREIPATLQDLVMARLDRMEGNPEVVQLAATFGREFSYEMLAAVSTLDEFTLQAELAKLAEAEILYQNGRPPRCSYIFKHALLEDAAYGALIKSKRQTFHQRIGEMMETRFPQIVEAQPELVAHHFTEAGAFDKSVHYWLKAGMRSRHRSADLEAISHLTKGLSLLDTLPDSEERDARKLELLNPLGTALIAARGYAAPEVGPVFQRARELGERVGSPQQQFAIMRGAFAWHVVRGDFRLCTDLAAEAMEFASALNDPGILMEALFVCSVAALYRGDFTGAREHCERAISNYD
ncbi:MAG TPA: protein kinase, partial [Blastocatellia bacterium]|nr:protein kinase [Blastocatellia bacterium]